MSRLDTKSFGFEVKSVDESGSLFEGLGAVFNVIDDGADLIHPRAYDNHIAEFRSNGKVRDEHSETIGKIVDADITSRGLQIKGQISDTARGRDVKALLRDGVISRLSVGQYTLDRKYLETPEEVQEHWKTVGYQPTEDDLARAGSGVRIVLKARPIEVSTTYNPMNRSAVITSVKSDGQPVGLSFSEHSDQTLAVLGEFQERAESLFAKRADDGRTLGPERIAAFQRLSNRLLSLLEAAAVKPDVKTDRPSNADPDCKGAVSFVAAPVVDKAWDAAAARKRLKAWAGDDMAKYRRGFAWYDAAKADDLGSYSLPHHDIDGGKLVTVKSAVVAALAALDGARGGSSIPDADKAAVRSHLARHYKQWGGEVPEKGKSMGVNSTTTITTTVTTKAEPAQSDQDGVLDVDVDIERGNPNASDLVDSATVQKPAKAPKKGDGVGDEQVDGEDVLAEDVVPGERDDPNTSDVVDSAPAPKPDKAATTTDGGGNAGGAGAIDACMPESGTKTDKPTDSSAPAPEAKTDNSLEAARLYADFLKTQADFISAEF